VRAFEDCELRVVFQFQVVQQLQPEVFELVCVVFEQFKVISDRTQNLVKLWLKLSIVFSHEDLVCSCRLFRFGLGLLSVYCFSWLRVLGLSSCWSVGACRLNIVINNYEAIFLSIFLELVLDSADNVLNLLLEEVEQGFTCDLGSLGLLLKSLLVLNDLRDGCVVVLEFTCRFSVVQVY